MLGFPFSHICSFTNIILVQFTSDCLKVKWKSVEIEFSCRSSRMWCDDRGLGSEKLWLCNFESETLQYTPISCQLNLPPLTFWLIPVFCISQGVCRLVRALWLLENEPLSLWLLCFSDFKRCGLVGGRQWAKWCISWKRRQKPGRHNIDGTLEPLSD